MVPWLVKLAHLVQLTRLTLAFTAVSNVWLMIFLATGLETQIGGAGRVNPSLADKPLALVLLLGMVVAVGLHSYGMALNDMLDARHDRMFSPHRPIAAGRISIRTGVAVAVLSLLLALLGAVLLGQIATFLCLLAAACILFFNGMGKYLPAMGILSLGLVRVLLMFLANPHAGFLWPVWVAMTHLMLCWAVAYRLEGKRPRLAAQQAWLLCAGWAGMSVLLLAWMRFRGGLVVADRPGLWIGAVVAGALFAIVTAMLLRPIGQGLRQRRQAGSAFLRAALLWLIAYDAGWLLGAGLYGPGIIHLALLAVAFASERLRLAVDQLTAPPPVYRLVAE
ncbi:MAG: UbiA family prenyltransferase [Phycisphaeraceae bacterium]